MTDRFDHFYVYDTVSYTEFTTFKQYIYSEGQLNAECWGLSLIQVGGPMWPRTAPSLCPFSHMYTWRVMALAGETYYLS